jgi:plastocyanin
MKKSLLKTAGLLVAGALLIGANGCTKEEAGAPATDTAQDTSVNPTGAQNSAESEAANPATQVLVTATGFQPQSVTVNVGETVTWTNQTSGNVRVASDPHPQHTGLVGFDDLSGASQGDFYSYTFEKTGTFSYHDHNNPTMNGTVVVQ